MALRMLYTGFNITIGLSYIDFQILDAGVLPDKSFMKNIVKTTVKKCKNSQFFVNEVKNF